MNGRQLLLLLALFTVALLAACGGDSPEARETAEAKRMLATPTTEARSTPTPSATLETTVAAAFAEWAQAQGEPYRDVTVKVRENDDFFALVQVIAWFRTGRDAPWEERTADVECRRVGEAWQCTPSFAFTLTEGELARRSAATATVEAQAVATREAQAQATAETQRAGVQLRKQAAERAAQQHLHPQWTTYSNANTVYDLLIDGDGVWTATAGGVVRWDMNTGEYIKLTMDNGLAANVASSVALGPDGAMWFGTEGGVSRLDARGSWQTFTSQDGLAHDVVPAIAAGPDGAMWFGTWGGGVSRLDARGSWQTFTAQDGLAYDNVPAIAAGPDGAMWFGTYHGGVSRLDARGSWQTFTTQDGLADDVVGAIAAGPDGAVWFGTWGGGVSRYHP